MARTDLDHATARQWRELSALGVDGTAARIFDDQLRALAQEFAAASRDAVLGANPGGCREGESRLQDLQARFNARLSTLLPTLYD